MSTRLFFGQVECQSCAFPGLHSYRRRSFSEMLLPGDELVFSRGYAAYSKTSVTRGDGEVGMPQYVNPSLHPVVDVTLDPRRSNVVKLELRAHSLTGLQRVDDRHHILRDVRVVDDRIVVDDVDGLVPGEHLHVAR